MYKRGSKRASRVVESINRTISTPIWDKSVSYTHLIYFVNAGHTDILDDTQMSQVFLTESHPKASTFDGREILN